MIFEFYKTIAAVLGDADKGGRLRWFTQDVIKLPIRKLDLKNKNEKVHHDRMVEMVDQMLEAKKSLARAQTDKDKTYFENKCASIDRQIDALVYELYGLTEEEIKIVEGASK